MTEPDPKPEPTYEPEAISTTPGAKENGPLSEPHPDWHIAKKTWGAAWPFHAYFIGILFAILVIFATVNLVGLLKRRQRFPSHNYFLSLNVLMIIFALCRAILLLVDAYNSNGIFPAAVAYLLMSMGFPCLTSSFYLLFSAIHMGTRVVVISPKIFSNTVLICVILFNFTLSIVTDLVVGFNFRARVLLIVCQAVYTVWGVLFSVAYFYLFGRLFYGTQVTRRELRRMSSPSCKDSALGEFQNPPPTISLATKITLVAAIFFLIISILNICGMASSVNSYNSSVWGWWAYHFIYRLCEIAMASTIMVVTWQPLRHGRL